MSKWDWGMKNRPGYLKPVTDAELYYSLLEVGEVTVDRGYLMLPGRFLKRRKGKNSKGLKYKCKWTKENGIQDLEDGQKQLPRLSCRFMRYSVGQIYIETPEGFQLALLTTVDDMYKHMSDECVKYDKEQQYIVNKSLKTNYDEMQSATRVAVSNILSQAKLEQIPINANEANSQDISANREEAIEREISLSQVQFNELGGESSNSFVSDANDSKQIDGMDLNVAEDPNVTASIFAAKMASSRRTRSIRGKA